jgi:sugar lactone lactonase YvrE
MMRLRFVAAVLGFSSLFAVACSDDVDDTDGDGGAGGEPAAPVGGEPTVPSGGGEGGSGCTQDATGTLVVEVTGLPAGVAPDVLIAGPDDKPVDEADVTLQDVASGNYTVSASRVFDEDPIVRTVFDATVTAPSFTLCDGDSHTIEISYEAIPSSNKLWMPTAMDNEGAGFDSAVLGESGLTDASVSLDGGIGKAIAFDRDGNMWTLGPTLDFPHVLRFPAAALGESGAPEPDVSFDVPEIACTPATKSLALDAKGNLWLSACEAVLRIPSASLEGVGGMKEADVLLAGLDDNQGLAVDKNGNLWVGTAVGLARYDAARLSDSSGDAPDLLLSVTDDTAGLRPWFLAFDKAGNLWAADAIANVIFQVAAADLTGTGEAEVEAQVSITLDVLALTDQIAFDESDGLWVGLALDGDLQAGGIGRLDAAQLGMSAGAGDPATPAIIVNSASIGSGLPVAFFPAPAGLPLFHSIPVE